MMYVLERNMKQGSAKRWIYISKTKAGTQYLDSLDGHASVSAEGSYKSDSFLILETSRNPPLKSYES